MYRRFLHHALSPLPAFQFQLRGFKSTHPVISSWVSLSLSFPLSRHNHFLSNGIIHQSTRLRLPSANSLSRYLATTNQQSPHQPVSAPSETIPERLVASMPSAFIPYAKLMRLNTPTGTWLLLWPCWWSIGLSTSAGALPSATLLGLFGAGAVLLRSSGCIINDLWDRKFDASVERTKQRPIAANQISPIDAVVLLNALNACGLLVILQFDLNSILLALSSMALVVVYPACKRFTDYPQVVLGMAFNWGALLGWSAATSGSLDLAAVLPLYLGGICWTLVYDTLYAHQDKKDDIKLGLKSTAIRFGENTSKYLIGFTGLMTASLALAGINTGQCWPYYLSVAACGGHLLRIITKTDIHQAEQCGRAFKENFHIGWILFVGIVLSTLLKEKPLSQETPSVEGEVVASSIKEVNCSASNGLKSSSPSSSLNLSAPNLVNM